MRDETIVKITAVTGLTIICVVALFNGIDHFLTATISGIIGGIAGYKIRGIRIKSGGEEE